MKYKVTGLTVLERPKKNGRAVKVNPFIETSISWR